MNFDYRKYDCSEYLDEYYKGGLFHPTECQNIFSHTDCKIDSNNQDLIIGEVWDDHDLLLCYRKEFPGLWGRYNRDKEYFLSLIHISEPTRPY